MDIDEELLELVVGCRAGDQAAWTALVQRFQRLVFAVVCRMGLDEHDAADVFQTVFERLNKHLPTLKDPDTINEWYLTRGMAKDRMAMIDPTSDDLERALSMVRS